MKKEIVGHYESLSPFVVITFQFENLDVTIGKSILQNLKLPTDVFIYALGRGSGVKRKTLGFHIQESALAVMVCYATNLDVCIFPEVREEMKKDVQAIAAAFETALSIFEPQLTRKEG